MAVSKAQKEYITREFEPFIDNLKSKLEPLPKPQQFNQCIDFYSKWRGNYFYIMRKYKTGENSYIDFFDYGLARLEYCAPDLFNLSFYHHSEKWEPHFMYEGVSLEVAKKAISEDPIFGID